jgi:hypothetical protein
MNSKNKIVNLGYQLATIIIEFNNLTRQIQLICHVENWKIIKSWDMWQHITCSHCS